LIDLSVKTFETLFVVLTGILREKFLFGCSRSEESQDVEELEKRLASLRRI